MATFNVPKIDTFGVTAWAKLDALTDAHNNSRWLNSTSYGNRNNGQAAQTVKARMAFNTVYTPYNPLDSNNPEGNCLFPYVPTGRVISTGNGNNIRDTIYGVVSAINNITVSTTVDNSSGAALTNDQQSVERVELLSWVPNDQPVAPFAIDMITGLPLVESVPQADTLLPLVSIPAGFATGVTDSISAPFRFTTPTTRPNPNWPPLPPPTIPATYPDPVNGIGVAKSSGLSFSNVIQHWEPMEIIDGGDIISPEPVPPCEPDPDNPQVIIYRVYTLDTENNPVFNRLEVCAPIDITVVFLNNEQVEDYQAVAGKLVPYTITYSVDLYLRVRSRFIDYPVSFSVGNIDPETLTVDVKEYHVSGGAGGSQQALYYVFADNRPNGDALAILGTGGAGILRFITVAGGNIVDIKYGSLPLSTGGSVDNAIEFIAANYNWYPFSNVGPYYNTGQLIVGRRELEAIDPTQAPGFDDEFTLSDAGPFRSFDLWYGVHYGAYYIVAGGQLNGSAGWYAPNPVYFILRDGSGYYELDLSDALFIGYEDDDPDYPEYDTIDYFAMQGGVIYIGSIQDNGDIVYRAIIPALPRGRLPQITLEYQAVGMSFIPCQTHCLGKGGIISKV